MSLVHQNIQLLEQGLELLNTLEDRLYSAPGPFGESSVGAHLRHALDFYSCFLQGLDENRIDYDTRERNEAFERESGVAIDFITRAIKRLRSLEDTPYDRVIQVQADTAAWQPGQVLWTGSTLGRELQFLLSHTVHHYALIGTVLRALGHDPGTEFGVAPSTLAHRSDTSQQEDRTVAEREVTVCVR